MHDASGATIGRALSLGLLLAAQTACSDQPPVETNEVVKVPLAGQQPVNPNASPKARELLQLLNDYPNRSGDRVISGQVLHPLDWVPLGSPWVPEPGHLASYPAPCDRVDAIYEQTGYWVGIASAEYTDWEQAYGIPGGQGVVSAALNPCFIAISQRGGIVSPHFHPMNPKDGTWFPGDPGSVGPVTADELLLPGWVHDNWIKILDAAAAGLRELRDNDVVVLWRPMHARDAGWWWGYPNMSRDDYRRIWAHMVDYFSNVWGLDNVLYVQSWYAIHYDPSLVDDIYAGDANVDIVAVDHAWDNSHPSWWATEYANLLAFGKPFGIGQIDCWGCDTRAVIDHIRGQWPAAAFFIGFDHPLYPDDGIGYGTNLYDLLSDPWVANAGEIFGCSPSCDGRACGAGDGCGGTCGSVCDAGCDHCSNGSQDCDEAGVDCGGADCGECSGSCGAPCDGGYVWTGDCQCYPCWDWCPYCVEFSDVEPDCAPAVAACGC